MEGKKRTLFFGSDGRLSRLFVPSSWDGIITEDGEKYTFAFQEEADKKVFLVLGWCDSCNSEKSFKYRLATRIQRRKLFELFEDRQAFLGYCDQLWIKVD